MALAVAHSSAVAPAGLFAMAADTVSTSLAFADVRTLAFLRDQPHLLAIAMLAVRLPIFLIVLATLLPAPEDSVPSAVAERADLTLRSRGRGALLPFQLASDKRRFVAPDGGVIVSGTKGRFVVALGDPIGVDDAGPAFTSFSDACRSRGQVPAVYQATARFAPVLAAAGMRVFRVGHEAIVGLDGFDLRTPRRANLRHTISRARRGGLSFEFHHGLDEDARARLLPGLLEADASWRRTAGPELGFTIGRFDPAEIDRLAIAVAVGADGGVVAFTTFRPMGDDGWVLDLMRRVPGRVPGAVEGCIVEAAMAMAAEGAPSLSLGLAPLAGIAADANGFEERALALAARLVRPWYDVEGLAFFKSKFDPTWVARSAAVPSRLHLPGLALALLGLHLGGFRRAARQVPGAAIALVHRGPAQRSPREAGA